MQFTLNYALHGIASRQRQADPSLRRQSPQKHRPESDLRTNADPVYSTYRKMHQRIIYIQYTNPACYPPLQHSSRILADAGYEVLFLGAISDGGSARFDFPSHGLIQNWRLPTFGKGFFRKLHYLVFFLWTAIICAYWRPRWIYVSDATACPPALLAYAITGCHVLFHEHDTPRYYDRPSASERIFRAARKGLAKVADLVVLPQSARLDNFINQTGRTRLSLCVWNCPSLEEVRSPKGNQENDPLKFYFHGSINSLRLPKGVLDALARTSSEATLTIVGYETAGSAGYIQEFLQHAVALGLSRRVTYLGALAKRSEIMDEAAKADIGLAFMPRTSDDLNMQHMAGASNKPFDYLAVGTMPIVSNLPQWREIFVDSGYAIACDPSDVNSLSYAMGWCIAHPAEARAKAESGRRRVLDEWHYERQFEPVFRRLTTNSRLPER